MDPVSLAIAIFGLPTVLVTTAKMLRKAVKSIKYAEREVLDLAREMEWFDGTCKRFAPCADETSEIVGHLKSWSKKAKVGYDELFSKVQVIATQPGYRQFTMKMLIARLRWNQSKSFIKYLRASLSVARQSMVAFTNIYHIEKLDREMAYLRSALSTSDIKCIEKMHGKTVEKRIEELQREIRYCRKERHKIDKELKEATDEISVYQKQNKDPNVVRETKVLSQFRKSVERYVEDVLPQKNTGRRPRRLQGGSSLVTSGPTSTTHTQSSESSHAKIVASESPPTTSETTSIYMIEKMQPDKEEAAITLKHCKDCPGTCILDLIQKIPTSNSQRKPEKAPHSDPVSKQGREDNAQDGTLEERFDGSDEQAGEEGPSVWQPTGAFEGTRPRGLRRRRGRSQSS